jgi:hypothetical protein
MSIYRATPYPQNNAIQCSAIDALLFASRSDKPFINHPTGVHT